jgi:hypothetical protein
MSALRRSPRATCPVQWPEAERPGSTSSAQGLTTFGNFHNEAAVNAKKLPIGYKCKTTNVLKILASPRADKGTVPSSARLILLHILRRSSSGFHCGSFYKNAGVVPVSSTDQRLHLNQIYSLSNYGSDVSKLNDLWPPGHSMYGYSLLLMSLIHR